MSALAAGCRRPDHRRCRRHLAATSRWSATARPLIRAEGLIDGYPVRVPMVDVNDDRRRRRQSIAWIDAAGGLRVGPQSAGAEPGPACYGRGGDERDGDRCVGRARLHRPRLLRRWHHATRRPRWRAAAVRGEVAEPLGMTWRAAALGIHRVLNAQMAEAIRLVSIGRGHRPARLRAAAARRRRAAARAARWRDDLGITAHRRAAAPRRAGGGGAARPRRWSTRSRPPSRTPAPASTRR